MNGVKASDCEACPHLAHHPLLDDLGPKFITRHNSRHHVDAFITSYMHKTIDWEILSTEEAFSSWNNMNEMPLVDDLMCILDKCKKRRDLGFSELVHVHIHGHGLEVHRVLGNYLVPLFVECGGMSTAHQVFERLSCRNEHSWTSLIQGYVECGEFKHAFVLLERMQEDGVHPNKYTLLALVKPCAKMKWVERGQIIHTEIVKEDFDGDPFIGSTLVNMYVKCGLLREAQDVFDALPVRDVVMWNTLIAGYVEHGRGEEALSYVEQMQLERIYPDAVTYAYSLKACRSIGAINMGRAIHEEIIKEGFEIDSFIGSTLVAMYAECDLLVEARLVFDKLPIRDVVLWSTLIAGYVEHGLGEEALSCLKQMQLEGLSPDAVTFVCSLKACSCIGAINRGQEIHAEIVKEGFERDSYIGNSLLAVYAKYGSFLEALEVFEQQLVRDVVLWNTLMTAYAEHGMAHAALSCLEQMQLEGVSPNAVTFICSLKACGSIRAIENGQEIHTVTVKEELEGDPFVGNSVVGMYAKCGRFAEARDVFDELPVQDVVSWSALIAGYTEHDLGEEALSCLEVMQMEGVSPNAITLVCSLKACGTLAAIDKGRVIHAEIAKKGFERDHLAGNTLVYMYAKCSSPLEAKEIFKRLPEKDIVSWNALISGFSEQGETESIFVFYAWMQEQGLSPDSVTFTSIIKACGNASALQLGKKAHSQVYVAGGLNAVEDIMSTALIDMYGRCGSMVDAQQVFDETPTHDLMRWTALITGYARQGESQLVLHLFEKMMEEGIQPNSVTFLSVLSACKHAGFVEKGQEYFQAMTRDYDISPTIKHQNCMVDLLGRAGLLDETMLMLEGIPLQPNPVTWGTILSACQNLGDVELATMAFEGAMRSGENQAAPFISLSNIFADANGWKHAKWESRSRCEINEGVPCD